MNIWDQTRELLKGLQSKASSVGSVLGKTYNNLPVYNLPNVGNQKAPVPSVGNTANTILNKKFLPGQKFTVSQSAANVWKQPGFMSAGARGVIDANTLGLHPGQPVQNNTLSEKLGYGIGFGAGFANPYNLAGKAFGGLAAAGRLPTTAIASKIVPKAIQKATPQLLKTSGKVLAEELAQSGGYVGGKRLLGQEQDFKSDLLAGIGMRGVFGSAGRLFGSNIAKHRTAMSELDIRDTKKAIMNILTNKANADYSVRFRKKDETFLRQIAGDYLDKNFAKAAPIQDIAQELMNRMRVDTGAKEFDLPRMGFAGKNQVKNNVAKQSFYDTKVQATGKTGQWRNRDGELSSPYDIHDIVVNGKKVGEVSATKGKDGRLFVSNIEIDDALQRKGIGSKVIQDLVNKYDVNGVVPLVNENKPFWSKVEGFKPRVAQESLPNQSFYDVENKVNSLIKSEPKAVLSTKKGLLPYSKINNTWVSDLTGEKIANPQTIATLEDQIAKVGKPFDQVRELFDNGEMWDSGNLTLEQKNILEQLQKAGLVEKVKGTPGVHDTINGVADIWKPTQSRVAQESLPNQSFYDTAKFKNVDEFANSLNLMKEGRVTGVGSLPIDKLSKTQLKVLLDEGLPAGKTGSLGMGTSDIAKGTRLKVSDFIPGRKITEPIEVSQRGSSFVIENGRNRLFQALANGDETIPVVFKNGEGKAYSEPIADVFNKSRVAQDTITLYRAAPNFPSDKFKKGTYFADDPQKARYYSESHYNGDPSDIKVEQFTVPKSSVHREPSTGNYYTLEDGVPVSRVAQESKGVTKPPFSMGFAGENQLAPLRNTGTGGYTNVRSLDNPLLNNKVSEINPTLQKSTSAINLEPQGIKQQSQRLPNTEAIRSTMNQPKSSPYNTQEYIKELTEKQQQAGGSDGPRGLKQKATNFLAEVKAKLVDETAPLTDILTASEKQNKFKVLPKQDIRLQIDRALRSKNLASQFAEDNGLVDAIKKAPDLNALDQYMIAKHAANVEKQGIKTGRDLARDQQLIQDLAPQYEATAQQVNQYSRKLLDYAVKSGLIDQKLAKGLVEKYPEYVPLNRIFSELEQPNFRGTGKGVASLSRQTVVQKLQGSEREIRSPIESLLLKTQDAFSQGERNIAAKQLASYRSLPGFEGLIKEVDAGSRAPHSFSFIDNGVKKTYATTREIEAAAKALNVEQMGILGKIISTPTRMLQLGATGLNIPFVVTNVVKDEVTGFVNSNRAAKTSILNPANYVKALFSAVKHDELYKDLVRNAGGGTSFDIARDAPNLSIAKIRSPKMYTVRHPLELLRTIENLVGRGEELGRIKNFEGTRQALLKEGRTLQDANLLGGQAARENTANFARRGSFGRVINWMIPFFNAGIQGSRQMVRSFQNAPAQTSTKVAATIFTPIAVATAWNLSDPQRKQIYADIPQHEKENNIILIPPDVTQDERGRYNVIKIPLPPGLSNLGTIVRRALETTQGLDAIKFGEIATNLITAGTSVDVTSGNKLASTFTPQLAKPLVESTTNTNLFTGQRIIPDYMKNRPAELQTRPGVTPIATGIGKLLNVSPLMVENFAQTQLGGLGSQLLGKESPIGNLERRFKKASGGELLDRVYEDSTKIQAINSQAKSLLEAGKKEEALKLIQSNKDLLMKTSKVKTIRSEVDTLQEYKNKVKADTRLTQEQKNKVLTLIQQKLNELSNVYNSVNQL